MIFLKRSKGNQESTIKYMCMIKDIDIESMMDEIERLKDACRCASQDMEYESFTDICNACSDRCDLIEDVENLIN